jgi:hypothetical protein
LQDFWPELFKKYYFDSLFYRVGFSLITAGGDTALKLAMW